MYGCGGGAKVCGGSSPWGYGQGTGGALDRGGKYPIVMTSAGKFGGGETGGA
jgi:hypothetical protein